MPKRILHVVTHMNRGGLETMIMNYYRHIDRSKVQFDFLVHREQKADYDDEILSMGGKIYRLQPLNPFSGCYRRSLDAFFAEHKEYEIVHSHLDCMAGIPLKYAKKYGVRVRIAHSHNNSQPKDAKYILKLFYKRQIAGQATRLFACGTDAGRWMFGTDDFTVLNNAIDAAAYRYDPAVGQQVRRELDIAENALVVGHVGRFCTQKNHSFLMDVFASVLQKRPDAVLVLIGAGELRAEMEAKARELGIADNVIFAGLRADVNRLLQALDVFMLPSLHEGLPLSVVEAQAAGLPCLISDKVPLECQKTDLVCQLPLTESPEVWAQAVLAAATQPRKDTLDQIRCSGFDVRKNAVWLENYYLGETQ
jgi:glycosyltransferase involved in cell wall biosynthesis